MRSGQLQAVRCKPLSAKEKADTGFDYDLIFGGTRHAAALRIPGFLLKVDVIKGVNREDAFVTTLEENLRRNDTNPIDDSYNMFRLKDSFGWDSDRIRAFYGYSQSKFSQVKRLKELDVPAQRRVASGQLSIADAMPLLRMDPATVAEVLATVPEELMLPTVEETTADGTPFDASVESNGTGHPAEASVKVKGKRGRPKKVENQDEINRKAKKAYDSLQKSNKKALSKTLHQKAKEKGVTKGQQRTVQELKAVLSDRDDDVSNILKQFIASEVNASDLDAELDRIKDALDAYEASKVQS